MKTGRDFTIGERAIIIIGALAEKPLDEINRLLREDSTREGRTFRPLAKSSYDQHTRGGYRKLYDLAAEYQWLYIEHPQSRTDVMRLRKEHDEHRK
jgi:hypothetical protein